MTNSLTRAHGQMPFATLLTANTVSQIGSMLTVVSVPWFVLVTTGSAAKTGLTGVFAALPFIIAGIFGGTLVDRLGFKRTSVIADVTSGITIALIPLLYLTVGLAFWQLLILVFLGNLFDTPGNTARQSLVPDLAGYATIRLERANAFMQAVPRVAILFGPPLAAVCIAAIGASNVLWLDAVTFLFSAVLIGLYVPSRTSAEHRETPPGRYFADLAEGLRFVWREPLIRAMAFVFAIGNFLDAPISLLLAVYATREYGSAVPLGLMFSALGAGAIIGSLGYGTIGHRLPRRIIPVLFFLFAGFMYATFAVMPPFPIVLAMIFVDGISAGAVNPLSATIRQERVPPALLGRVQGIAIAISYVAIPVGRGIAGVLIAPVGLATIFACIAAVFWLLCITAAIHPAFRDMRTPAVVQRIEERPAATPRAA